MDLNSLKILNQKAFDKLQKKGFPGIKNDRWKYTKAFDILPHLKDIVGHAKGTLENIAVEDSFALLALSLSKVEKITLNGKLELKNINEKATAKALFIEVIGDSEIVEESQGATCLPLIFINVKAGHLKYIKKQKYNNDSVVVDNTIINLSANSSLSIETISLGAKVLRNNLKVTLRLDSHADIKGLYKVAQHLDNYLRIEHLEKSSSSQLYKGVADNGEASFSGSIYIAPEAGGSSAHQMNKNMILGNGKVNAKPELEILHDDVECTHGATISGISEQEIFYAMSRGISREDATNMLIEAFLYDLRKLNL